jgi:hypothetical protein
MVVKLGHFRKRIRNNLKALKCSAGERWRKSVGLIMRKLKKYYTGLRRKLTSWQLNGLSHLA